MTTVFNSDFEENNFLEWSYVQGQDTSIGPGSDDVFVGNSSALGITPHGGSYAAQFQLPSNAGSTPHAKTFKEWSNVGKNDQWGNDEDVLPNSGDPSGSYKAWYFLPSNYDHSDRDWTNIFQFKEEGFQDSVWTQDPSYWINMSAADAHDEYPSPNTTPVMFVNNWGSADLGPRIPVPLGQWFEIRADLYEGDRIDWFLNGQKFDTSLDSEYPVGRFYDQSDGWIFGVGHYDGAGKLFVDDASMETHPANITDPAAGNWQTTPSSTQTFAGTSASETINGTSGNDRLGGLAGEDTMVGGAGGDTYVVNSASDITTEGSNAGVDTVEVATSFEALAANIENLVITRSLGASVWGNSMDNVLVGSGAFDTLRGATGKDKMTGNGGNDNFYIRKGDGEGDLITDFTGNGTATGDTLTFENYGVGATLSNDTNGTFRITHSTGTETFTIQGVTFLSAGDYAFI